MEAKLIKVLEHYHLYDGDKAIATTIVGNPMLLPNLSLKNCQTIERGYDLDEFVQEYLTLFPSEYSDTDRKLVRMGIKSGFKEGFQKALSILGDKKFSEDDVISMIEKSRETGLTAEYLILNNQQTEWEVEIVMECCGKVYSQHCDGICEHVKPLLDVDGCIILKRK